MTNHTTFQNLSKRDKNTIIVALSTSVTENYNAGYYSLAHEAMLVYNKINTHNPYPQSVIDSVAGLRFNPIKKGA